MAAILSRAAVCALALFAAACGSAAPPAPSRTAADLTNTRLSPERSQWLVGAIAWLATAEEIAAYIELTDDAAAAAFEEAFWQRRDPDPARPGNPARQLFEQRAREADKRFSEAGYLGRRTDRGALFVLHGEPDSVEFEINPLPEQPPIEVWKYAAPHEVALNGRVPVASYRFAKTGDITTIYRRPAELNRVIRNPRRPFP